MQLVLLCLLAMTGVAFARPPGEASAEPAAPVTYTVGADAHAAFGELVGWNLAARFELGIARWHALVLRAGTGQTSWLDSEGDDPTYHEILARVGYRISSRRVFAGIELGESWFKAHYPPGELMSHAPQWFDEVMGTALVGLKLGRVRLSLDYTHDFSSPLRQVGVQLGVDVVHL